MCLLWCALLSGAKVFEFLLCLFVDKPDDVHLNQNTTNKVCVGTVIRFTCSAEANPAIHTYLLYKNDTVIYNMASVFSRF